MRTVQRFTLASGQLWLRRIRHGRAWPLQSQVRYGSRAAATTWHRHFSAVSLLAVSPREEYPVRLEVLKELWSSAMQYLSTAALSQSRSKTPLQGCPSSLTKTANEPGANNGCKWARWSTEDVTNKISDSPTAPAPAYTASLIWPFPSNWLRANSVSRWDTV